jgi:MoaA/NifB/PqqE/SkfB family radical SAM enzyme
MANNMHFDMLRQVLAENKENGLSIIGKNLIPKVAMPARRIPLLKHYMVDDSIIDLINHNIRWAEGKEEKPRFKFAYLNLPTECNQRCEGCYTGKDKGRLPHELNGKMYSDGTLEDIISFLKEHGVEAIVYGGGGELFTWNKAFDYIEHVTRSGLGLVIFTNGTLLSREDVEKLNQKDISLIVSLRDTTEKGHNSSVRINGFRKTIQTIEYAMQFGMHNSDRLAVEMPITRINEERVLFDFIPAMRHLGIIPHAEEYIQVMTSKEEKKLGHDFSQVRNFFARAAEIDAKFGYKQQPSFGQRIIAQPKCARPRYSLTVYPSGDVTDCTCPTIFYGNIYERSLKDIIYSEKFRSALRDYELCPCSAFYTEKDSNVPHRLPKHLEGCR